MKAEPVYYHGSSTAIRDFRVQSARGVQYGGGIYFSDSIRVSQGYGSVLHVVNLNTKKFCDETAGVDRPTLKNIAMEAPASALKRLDNDPKVAMADLIKDATDQKNMVDALYVLWYDGFNQDSVEFCKACAKHRVSGVRIKAISAVYYIVYDPRVITLLDTQKF